jgi:hypothetical protein
VARGADGEMMEAVFPPVFFCCCFNGFFAACSTHTFFFFFFAAVREPPKWRECVQLSFLFILLLLATFVVASIVFIVIFLVPFFSCTDASRVEWLIRRVSNCVCLCVSVFYCWRFAFLTLLTTLSVFDVDVVGAMLDEDSVTRLLY